MDQCSSTTDFLPIEIIREPAYTRLTPRKREICADFGIPPREAATKLADSIRLPLRPGTITLLLGASGSGKSSVLEAISNLAPRAIQVVAMRFPRDRCVADSIMPRAGLQQALQILTVCGLGEPRLWTRSFGDLSEGEQFRARLARAVGAAMAGNRTTLVLCDEFSSGLHRRAAKAIAFNLRKLITRMRLILCVASSHDDIVEDMQPDRIIRLGGPSPVVEERAPQDRPVSVSRGVRIEPGGIADYERFSRMHYRHRDALGFVDKVFMLRESRGSDPLGIAVFAHGSMELAMRNVATGGRFCRNLGRLNRELRILRRLVMHPDVRGCGLGHWFVKRTLPLAGVRFVECLAAMGAVNPVFERAGMSRVGRCPLPRGRMELLERMREIKLDPFADDLENQIARNARVRRLVERTIADWSGRAHSARKFRVKERGAEDLAAIFRQITGRPPMYYLWDREGEFPCRANGGNRPD
jgi:ABC-type lipoprotein export system ATPase subunit